MTAKNSRQPTSGIRLSCKRASLARRGFAGR